MKFAAVFALAGLAMAAPEGPAPADECVAAAEKLAPFEALCPVITAICAGGANAGAANDGAMSETAMRRAAEEIMEMANDALHGNDAMHNEGALEEALMALDDLLGNDAMANMGAEVNAAEEDITGALAGIDLGEANAEAANFGGVAELQITAADLEAFVGDVCAFIEKCGACQDTGANAGADAMGEMGGESGETSTAEGSETGADDEDGDEGAGKQDTDEDGDATAN